MATLAGFSLYNSCSPSQLQEAAMFRKLPVLLIMIIFTCGDQEHSLDDLRSFVPDDKYFKAGLITLHFIIETSPLEKSEQVFSDLIKHYNLPTNAMGCPDGTFIGASPYDAYDYRHEIRLTIRNEKIVQADYNEIHRDGRAKQEDSLYCAEMSASGTTPAIAYPEMEKQFLAEQDLLKIDAVSGASYSLYRMRYAAMIALIRSKLRD
jgi:major membrane immunogen (membrane-anchored lipoprotein)